MTGKRHNLRDCLQPGWKDFFIRRNCTTPGWEDDDIRGRACPRCWTWFVWSFIMFSWLLRPLHINQMLFYHRPDPMLVLEINPIVGLVANYLCLVLGYLGKFLYYKTLTGWPWENLLKKNYSHIQVTVILLDGILSLGQLIRPALNLAKNLSFLLLLKLNQSNKQSFSKGGKNLPQLWDGFIYITPGYGNLGLKCPLCWKQLNHTKDIVTLLI